MKLIKTPQEFEEEFNESKLPIILDFYTDSCNPCKSLMPILERLSFEFKGKVTFLKTKADENVILAQQIGVTSVPTLIFVNKNKEIERAKGLITESALRNKINEILNED